MRIILFKKTNSLIFQKYVDIGYCERDYYFLCTYQNNYYENKSGKKYYSTYLDWFQDFQSIKLGAQLITINYYLTEYNSYNNPIKFGEIYGSKTAETIMENHLEFSNLNNEWFYKDSTVFKGLDLGYEYDELEDLIESKIENELGIIEMVKFKDGSEVKFLDEDDQLSSLYVIENDFEELKNQTRILVEKFNY